MPRRNLTRELAATRTSSVGTALSVPASGFLGILASALAVTPAAADQKKWNTAGNLDCTMGPSIGLVAPGLQRGRCVFKPPAGSKETYIGRMQGPGIDRGIKSGAKLSWTVIATPPRVPANSLVGSYNAKNRASAEASAEGADLLCNDVKQPVCLRPVGASEANTNQAFEVAGVTLEHRKRSRRR